MEYIFGIDVGGKTAGAAVTAHHDAVEHVFGAVHAGIVVFGHGISLEGLVQENGGRARGIETTRTGTEKN